MSELKTRIFRLKGPRDHPTQEMSSNTRDDNKTLRHINVKF